MTEYIVFINTLIILLLFRSLLIQYKSYVKLENGDKNLRRALLVFVFAIFLLSINRAILDAMLYGVLSMDTALFLFVPQMIRIEFLTLAVILSLFQSERNYKLLSIKYLREIILVRFRVRNRRL